jgi:hypothetical protein
MVNYQLRKIYKIVDNTNGNIYIGSTCEPTLARRLSQHCGEYRFYLNKEIKKNVTSFQIIKNNNYNIILLETYPCNSKDELHAKERFYIENNNCVNHVIPGRKKTPEYGKEYYENNKTQLLEKFKEYRLKNKEEIKKVKRNYYITNKDIIQEKKSMKILCSCGKLYTKSNKQCHETTKFHKNYILNNPVEINL